MISKPIGIAALAVGIVAAAGLGSYFAVRSSQSSTEAAAVTQPADPAATAGAGSGAAAGATPGATPGASAAAATPGQTAQPGQTPAVSETEGAITPPAPVAEPVERAKPEATRPSRTPSRTASRPQNRPEPPLSQSPSVEPPPPTQVAANTPSVPAAPVEPPPPPKPTFEELTIPADSVIGLQIENSVSSETAKVEDNVNARVTRDVRVGGEVAIPAGTRARGNVTVVEQGGKFKEQARLGVRFHTLVLGDGTTVPIQTETIYRDGDKMGNKSTAKVGGAAAGGAIIGAILGGGKGAAIGTAIGAGAGATATAAGPRSKASMLSGSTVTVRLSNPSTVTVQKE